MAISLGSAKREQSAGRGRRSEGVARVATPSAICPQLRKANQKPTIDTARDLPRLRERGEPGGGDNATRTRRRDTESTTSLERRAPAKPLCLCYGAPWPAHMPPSTVINIVDLVSQLRADVELKSNLSAEKWQELDVLYGKYQVRYFPVCPASLASIACQSSLPLSTHMLPPMMRRTCFGQSKEVDQGAIIKGLCDIVGQDKIKACVRAAKNAAKAATAPPPPATQPHATAASSAKRPAASVDAGDASSKRPRAAGDPGALSSGYAAAAAASEGAGDTGGDNGDDGSKKEANPLSTFDPMRAAGVDVSVEESGAEILARDGGEDEAARFGSGAMGEQLRKKLSEMSRRFGLSGGADEAACRMVAVALQERMTCIIEELRPAVHHRSNADKDAFGEGAFTKGTDPKVSWKVRAAQTKATMGHAAPEPAAAPGGCAGAGVTADGSGATSAAGASADARRLESLARQDAPPAGALSLGAAAAAAASAAVAEATAAAATAAAREVVAGSADVLYVLDGDHQASRSRVVQWWRCTNAPLVRYARHTARLFPPPPAPPNA
jgi:hypothetical protein